MPKQSTNRGFLHSDMQKITSATGCWKSVTPSPHEPANGLLGLSPDLKTSFSVTVKFKEAVPKTEVLEQPQITMNLTGVHPGKRGNYISCAHSIDPSF
jgi:hypothetical protein